MPDTQSLVKMAAQVLKAILETIEDTGERGAPSGMLYAALMSHGCNIETYNALMNTLERHGKVYKIGHVYYAVRE